MSLTPSRSLLLALALATVAAGCEPYRIEYRRRPGFYQQMTDETLPDREVREDGTIVIYSARARAPSTVDPDGERQSFEIREEHADGTVILRALLPEHVLANMLHCLRYEEYELLWDQLVSERTKRDYAAEGKDFEDFGAYLHKHRLELARMLNRMRMGLGSHETVVDNLGDGILVCRFWPRTAEHFKFKKVVLVREDYGLKLFAIQ